MSSKPVEQAAAPLLVQHTGGCHCGSVRFSVFAPKVLMAIDCDCSICRKKQNIHFIVPSSQFSLLQGENALTTYTFNTHQAKHMFCKVCGVQSFYIPRSNPDGFGVMPHCLDEGTVENVIIEKFKGSTWEESMQAYGDQLKSRSQPQRTETTLEGEEP